MNRRDTSSRRGTAAGARRARLLARIVAVAAGALVTLGSGTPLRAQEVPAQEAPPTEPEGDTYVVAGTGADGLTLRASPGPRAPVLGVLPEGTSVHLLRGPVAGADGRLDWYEVQLRGSGSLSGYASGAFLAPLAGSSTAAALPLPLPLPVVGGPVAPPPGSRTFPGAVVTGYANGSDGGAVGSVTASGTRTRWGVVAADRRLFPFGTRLLIEGFEDTVFVVEDTGSGVRGLIFDVWFPDVPTAVRFGTQRRTVTVLPPGT